MAFPVPVVEIAFSDGPYTVSPTWTDVTAYVTALSTNRGRDGDWDEFTGTANVTLLNTDRRFDPFYTSGPYYGNLKPRRQIRIRSTWNGTTYDVFRGFIQGWPPSWSEAGKFATVELSCFDALDLLGSSTMPVDWAAPYIATLSPTHYWKCNDPVLWYDGTATLTDSGSAPLNLSASNAYQGGQLAPGLPQTSIASTSVAVTANTTTPFGTASDISFTFWASATIESVSPDVYTWTRGWALQGTWQNTPGTADYGKFIATADNGTTKYTWKTTKAYDSSEVYHFAFTLSGTTGTIYINGVSDTSARTSSATAGPYVYEFYGYQYGGIAQWCVFPSALTAANVATIVSLSQGQAVETTSARVSRIIGNTPYSTSLVSTPASPAGTVAELTAGADTATTALGSTAASEYAPLFVNKAGTLTLYSQSQIRSQTSSIVSQATFGTGGQSIGPQVQLQYDGDAVRNIANITVGTSGTITVTNSASVTAVGQADLSVETQVSTTAQATNIGNIASGWGGQVYPAADEVEVVLSPSGTWSSVLGLELCDRYTLAVTPPTGNTITTAMLANRVRHEATPGEWRSYLTGSARWAAVFILDTSVLDGTDLLG